MRREEDLNENTYLGEFLSSKIAGVQLSGTLKGSMVSRDLFNPRYMQTLIIDESETIKLD